MGYELEDRDPLVNFYLHLSSVDDNNDIAWQNLYLILAKLSSYPYSKALFQLLSGNFLFIQFRLHKEINCFFFFLLFLFPVPLS